MTNFKFVRDEEGYCIMYYRNYSHMKWEGPQRLLKAHELYGAIIIIIIAKEPAERRRKAGEAAAL